jgi:hypothetical protein
MVFDFSTRMRALAAARAREVGTVIVACPPWINMLPPVVRSSVLACSPAMAVT